MTSIQLRDSVITCDNADLIKMFPFIKETQELNTSRFVFDRVVEFAEHYNALSVKARKLMETPEVISGKTTRLKEQKAVWSWCNKFYKKFKTGTEILELKKIAEKLESDILSNMALCMIAQDLDQNLSVAEFRKKYELVNDLSAEEIAQLDKEEQIYADSK